VPLVYKFINRFDRIGKHTFKKYMHMDVCMCQQTVSETNITVSVLSVLETRLLLLNAGSPLVCIYPGWPVVCIYGVWPVVCIYPGWPVVCIYGVWPVVCI